MGLGQHYLLIVVSVVILLGAAAVAVICYFLKRNNDQLREINEELKTREEQQRLIQALNFERKQPAAPAAIEKPVQPSVPKPVPAPVSEPRATTAAVTIYRRPAPKAVVTTRAPEKRTDWNALLAGRETAVPNPQPAAVRGIPAGYHDGHVLSQLVQSNHPVTGLVVSIGVNAPREADGSLPKAVPSFVQSLIGPDDFACQSNEEEFLLIYPNERGASAQRRLNRIAQQLWDFQLTVLGTSSILFSWGGLEVRSESIDEAMASANDRMQETKRGRKLLMMVPRAAELAFRAAV